MLKALETNLNETQTAMESWEKRALISESREERQNREIKILRKQVTDFQVIQSENENLVKIVREMKKSLGSAQELQGGGHPPVSPIDVAVIESERNLLKKIQQESMLIVERESFRESLAIISLSLSRLTRPTL
jgi:Ulp1 family protease